MSPLRSHLLLQPLIVAVLLLAGLAESQSDLALTVLSAPSEVAPRQTVNLVVNAENRSNGAWSGVLQPDIPPGWRLLIPPAPVTLAPGESVSQVFTLLVPPDASAGSYKVLVQVPGESVTAVEIGIAVRGLAELKAIVLQAPELVVAGVYQVSFLLSNSGNVGANLVLSVADNLGLPLALRPKEIGLLPGESREVVVHVEVPEDLSASAVHLLTLRAAAEGEQGASLAATALASVELIPLRADPVSGYHTFPLRLRATGRAALHGLAASPPKVLERAEAELSGEGKLWDEQPGTLRVRLGTGVSRDQQQALLEYRREEFRVALGRQNITPTPLFPELAGVGVNARAEGWPTSALRLAGETFVLSAGSGSRFGGRAELTLEESLRGSVQLAAAPHETHFGTRWQLLADPASASPPVQVTDLEVEYVLRLNGRGEIGRALWLGGGVAAGPLAAEVGFKAWEGSYVDEDDDFTSLSAEVSLGFGVAFPSDLSLRYLADRAYALGTLLSGPRLLERYDARFEVELAGTAAGTELGLEYVRESQNNLLSSNSRSSQDGFSVSIGSFFEPDEQLQQRIELTRETRESFEQPRYSFAYLAGLRTPSLGGNLTSEVDLRYSAEQREFSRLDLRTEWSGPLTGELELTAGGTLGLVGDRVSELEVEGRYAPDDKRQLTAELLGTLYRSRTATLRLRLAYFHAFDVAVSPLSNVGTVSGRVVDAEGNPLERLVVRVAGRSAVTQHDGTFLFPAVPEGKHRLSVHPDTLSRNQLTVPATPLPVQVEAGSEMRVELSVHEAARLQGRVRFVVPEREGDAAVYGLGRPEEESALVGGILLELGDGETVVRSITDRHGVFGFARLAPGRWRLTAVAEHLSGLYRLEPAEQTLDLAPGANEVAIELLPRLRPVRMFEGGVVGNDVEPEQDGD